MSVARQGKIARLPHAIREEVNQWLLNGYSGPIILSKLNARPEVQAILAEHFDGAQINPQNLSEWRQGGYQDFLRDRESAVRLRSQAEVAASLAKASLIDSDGSAGNPLTEGATAMLSGQILAAIETGALDLDADDEAGIAKAANLIKGLTSLRNLDLKAAELALKRRRQTTTEEALKLAQAKFETQTVSTFLKWQGSAEAQAILTSGQPKHVQMDMLRELFFGPAKKEGE